LPGEYVFGFYFNAVEIAKIQNNSILHYENSQFQEINGVFA